MEIKEIPKDFNYDITPTLYGMLLSVTVEKPDIDDYIKGEEVKGCQAPFEDFIYNWGFTSRGGMLITVRVDNHLGAVDLPKIERDENEDFLLRWAFEEETGINESSF